MKSAQTIISEAIKNTQSSIGNIKQQIQQESNEKNRREFEELLALQEASLASLLVDQERLSKGQDPVGLEKIKAGRAQSGRKSRHSVSAKGLAQVIGLAVVAAILMVIKRHYFG